jgi:hypothetical protein
LPANRALQCAAAAHASLIATSICSLGVVGMFIRSRYAALAEALRDSSLSLRLASERGARARAQTPCRRIAAPRRVAIACIPARLGWMGAAGFTGTMGSTQRTVGNWQAS